MIVNMDPILILLDCFKILKICMQAWVANRYNTSILSKYLSFLFVLF